MPRVVSGTRRRYVSLLSQTRTDSFGAQLGRAMPCRRSSRDPPHPHWPSCPILAQGTIQHLEAQAMAAANAVSAMGSVFPFEGVQFTNDKLGLLSVGSTDCTGGILNSTRLAEETMAQGPHSVEQRFSSLGLPLGGRVRGGTPDSPAWLRTHNAPAPASSCVGGSEGAASQMSTVPSVARPGSVGGAPSPSPASSAIGSLPSSSVAARDEAAHPAPTAFKWVSGVGAGITPPLPAKAQPARLDGLAREAAAAADAAAAAQAAAAARGPRSLSNASANGTDTQANVAHNANVAAAAAAAAASRLMHAEAEACSQARGSGSKSVAVSCLLTSRPCTSARAAERPMLTSGPWLCALFRR
mmetsp:Transcript_30059/g.82118  ORF Transcript_30059/g.82118 Transcript_30059/m.82118 type:complete len:356 (-) Transcript_30059:1417-2484(-)